MLTLRYLAISAIFFFLFAIKADAAVVINEIFYDPPGTDTGQEAIELYNNGNAPVDLTGYDLNAVSGDYFTFPTFTLAPNAFVVIHWRAQGTNSVTDLYTGTTGFAANMGNTSGWAALFASTTHSKDTIIDYIEYGAGGQTWESAASNAGIWTAGVFAPDGDEGTSLGRTPDGKDTNAPGDWSVFVTPSLGTSNGTSSASPPSSASGSSSSSSTSQPSANQPPKAEAGPNRFSFANEPLAFSAASSTDPEGAPLSFFWNFGDGSTETKATTTHPYKRPGRYIVTLAASDGASTSTASLIAAIYPRGIVISEFLPNAEGKDVEEEWIEIWNGSEFLADLSDWKLSTGKKTHSLPPYTFLLPGRYLVLERQTTTLALSNAGGTLELQTPEGFPLSSVSYEKAPLGQSSTLQSDGAYRWTPNPTPGSPPLLLALTAPARDVQAQPTLPAQDSAVVIEGSNALTQAPAVIPNQDMPRPAPPPSPAESSAKAGLSQVASLANTLQSSPFLMAAGTSLVAIGLLLFLKKKFRQI